MVLFEKVNSVVIKIVFMKGLDTSRVLLLRDDDGHLSCELLVSSQDCANLS